MSVRVELDEVVAWLADRLAKDAPPARPTPLERPVWQHIHANLKAASEKLVEVQAGLPVRGSDSFLAELAGDLVNEADALALRAQLLARRTPGEHKAEPKPKTETEHASAGRPEPPTSTGSPTNVTEPPPAEPVPVSTRLAKAQGTIETAYEKLKSPGELDPVAKAFEEQLDVLAEMTLGLQQRVKTWEGKHGSP